MLFLLFFFNDTPPTEIYTLSLHDALPIWPKSEGKATSCGHLTGDPAGGGAVPSVWAWWPAAPPLDCLPGLVARSEEHTSELQSHVNLVCRLLLEKKKKKQEAASLAT